MLKESKKKEVVNLLWTGGWDSTFRLLLLLLKEKKAVQPFYLKFPTKKIKKGDLSVRKSTHKEIKVMENIRKKLFRDYPSTKKLLKPIKIVDAATLSPDKIISQSFYDLVEDNYIGNQYITLARFSDQYKIDELELSIHLDDKAHDILEPFVEKKKVRGSVVYKIKEAETPSSIYQLFKNFTFPIFYYSKRDMGNIADNHNWKAIMKLTWFCHHPVFGSIPCGICNPCIYTIEEGLGWRVPIFLRIFGRSFKKIYNSKGISRLKKLLSL